MHQVGAAFGLFGPARELNRTPGKQLGPALPKKVTTKLRPMGLETERKHSKLKDRSPT